MSEGSADNHAPDYTPAQIMAAISLALKAGDMPAAAGLVRLLAVKDPASAQMILDGLELLSLVEEPASVTPTGGGQL